jgi:CheY-like chemotaxis protein
VAADGAAGLAQFREHHYEAVITDLLMPGMNGLEVATALRTLDPGVQIIMLTGSAPSLSTNRAREAGVNTLLHKPIALMDLKSAIDAACSAGCR